MSTSPPAVTTADDDQLIALVQASTRRLVFMAPGASLPVARAICDQSSQLNPHVVNVILDVDPEVCRLGYGTLDALKLLQETSQQLGTAIHHQPGVRIGLIIADAATLIFTPIPLLIEGASAQQNRPNAIRLDTVPPSVAREVGLGDPEASDRTIGRDKASPTNIEEVAKDLAGNPPTKFDISRKVRVFNSLFEFVEIEVRGCSISRRTVPIPSDLIGLAKDPKAQKLLRSSFKLIPDDSSLSGDRVNKLKQCIARRYLIHLKGYGHVVLRENKPELEAAIEVLRRYVARFQRRVEAKLQEAIGSNRASLVNALLPAVVANPPAQMDQSSRLERQPRGYQEKARFGISGAIWNRIRLREPNGCLRNF